MEVHNKEFSMAWSTYVSHNTWCGLQEEEGSDFSHEPWDSLCNCLVCDESYNPKSLLSHTEGFCSRWCEKLHFKREEEFLRKRMLTIAKRIGIVYTLKLNKVINYANYTIRHVCEEGTG